MQFKDYPIDHLMEITPRPPLVMTHGEGSWLWDHTGRRYLDFVQGWAVNALGHSPRCIVEALAAQAPQLITPSPAFYNEPALQLAALLTRESCLDQVFFTNSGAEANEGAIKLARKWGRQHKGGAHEIITTLDSFHGRTLATMSASGKAGWDTMFAPQVPGFPKAVLNDLSSVERLITAHTVAIMVEPVQGEGGVNCASPAFLQGLRELADQHRLLLIFDEVQTGIGRLGTLFGYQHYGVEPDIMTLGKGLGGGVPLAALLAKRTACVFEHGEQGGTYNGNPLMTAVGLAVVQRLLEPGFLPQVRAMGAHLSSRLTELCVELDLGGERGIGLLRALELKQEIGTQVVTAARDALEPDGLLLNAPRPSLLRFMPALNVTAAEIDRMIDGLRSAITLVHKRA
ncbi:MAG: acetylornithine transaminase [Pseudomonadales bacterium]|nr:acetylornithine transaminase [Pseudomonadales bacterium]